jgi:type II secretory pathway pseudopilin PulG
MMIAVMFMLAVIVIALAAAAPKVKEEIQRDREVETMQRGKQYIRAIQLYYKKFHAYPPNMEALVKTNEIRFLRKKYIDPMTGKDDWKPIMYCQNKTPMAMGFFGQPMAGAGCGAMGGIGQGGGNNIAGANPLAGGTNGTGGSTGNGLFSNTGNGGSGDSSATASTGSDAGSGTGTTDANGTPINTTGSPLGGGQTFGGAGIVGVKPSLAKQSILVYKKKNHYNEWEFLYSPLSDQRMISGGNAGALGQQGTGIGSGTGNNGIGGNGVGNGLNQQQQGGGGNQNNGTDPITPVLPPETTAPPQ